MTGDDPEAPADTTVDTPATPRPGGPPAEPAPDAAAPSPALPRADEGPRRRLDGIRTLFGDPSYRNYWIASSLFGLSIWAFITAMGWSALELTDSAFRVSMVNVIYFLPMFLFAVPSGVLADVIDRRRNVLWSRGLSAVLVTVMAVLAATGALTYVLLCALCFLVGLSVITEVASRQALVAQIVPAHRLVGAAALTNFQGGLARVLGPLFAGWLIARTGDGGGYALFVAANIAFVLVFRHVTVQPIERTTQRRPLRDLVDGFRYLRTQRYAAVLVTLSVLSGTIGWLYLALLPVMARDVLGGDAATLGVLSTAVGLGSLPGAIGFGIAVQVRREGRWYLASMLTWGLGIAAFGLAPSFILAFGALFVAGMGFGMQTILTQSLLLRIVDPAYHGRVMGTLMLTYGANIIGTLAGGWVAETMGAPIVIVATGCAIVCLTLMMTAANRGLLRL